MTRVAIRSLLGRKLRFALTSLAIVMGVAMVSGTFVLTDTINAGFKTIFTVAYAKSDAVVTGKQAFGSQQNRPSFPATTLDRVHALPDVLAAEGGIVDSAQFVGRNGKVLAGLQASLAFSVNPNGNQALNPLTLVSGEWPVGPGEVAMDQSSADSHDFTVGQSVGVSAEGGAVKPYRISGLIKFGTGSASLGGATFAIFDLPTAQAIFHKQGELDEINVAGKPGTSSDQLLSEISSVLPPHTQVQTGQQQATSSANDVAANLKFLQYFLLAFGGIALFVGAFVIANTLSITVAQRTREFATLRAMGAKRRQIRTIVVIEGVITGLFASIVGLFAGLGLAKLLDLLFKAFGADLPQTGLVFAWKTVIISVAVGTIVTVLASLRPAVRATRVPPIAAVREGSILPPGRFARFGPVASLVVCLAGLAILGYGAFGNGIATGPRLLMLAVGMIALFIGIAMISSKIVRPLASVLAWPGTKIGGVAGTLARSNSMRNPGRTASTAAALMIGLALVTAVAVLAAGLRGSFEDAVSQEFHADYALTSEDGFTPTSVSSEAALRASGYATAVAGVRAGTGRVGSSDVQVTGVDPELSQMITLKWTEGSDQSLATLGATGAIISKKYGEDHDLTVGSPVTLETGGGKLLNLKISAIFDPPPGGSPLGNITISAATFDSVYPNPQNVFAFALTPGGVTQENTANLTKVLGPFPDAKIQTEEQFIATQESGLNTFLVFLYILLGLSIIVSLFGIVNTMVLTIYERTRELGMLRAVGMSRRQVRRMIRHEAIVIALIGAAIGIPVGAALAALFENAIGGVPFEVPWGTMIAFVIAAIIVGLLAAIFPARRAAKLNVLEALQYE